MHRLAKRRRKLLLGGRGVAFNPAVNPPIWFSAANITCDENTTLAHVLVTNEP